MTESDGAREAGGDWGLYPIVVVEDRYSGSYSKGAWLAVANADKMIDGMLRSAWVLLHGPHGRDLDAMDFWAAPPEWVAAGSTPDEAIGNLRRSRLRVP